jgi:cell division protein FtsQ
MPRLIAPPDRPSRWKLLWRRQRRRLRTLLMLTPAAIILLGIGIVLLHAAGRAGAVSFRDRIGTITASAGLRVKHIEIDGRINTPQPALDTAIGIAAGAPILGFSVTEARARLETISWVQNATVERLLPDTIFVSLVERRPFAIWQNQGKFSLIDRDGKPVPDQDVGAFGALPLVVGAGAAEAAAALLDALDQYPMLKTHVVAAVRVGERRWNLHLTSGGDVLLPESMANSAVPAALHRLADLQQVNSLLDRPLQVVDLRLPDRMVLRPQPGEPKGNGG